MGGQNAKISKHAALGRMGWSTACPMMWRLRPRSVWVARMQGFPSILRREGWEGAFQLKPYGSLGSGQYGWPVCKDFQDFCCGKGGLEQSCWDPVSMGGQNAMISKHSAAGRVGGRISKPALWQLRVRSVWVARMQ